MLANVLRIQLALELALYLAAGRWLHSAHEWSVLGVVAGLVAFALGVRLALVLISTTLSWLFRSPRPPEHQLGVLGTASLVLGEWRAMLADNLFCLPFERIAVRPDPRESRGVPVLLVHGYASNRGMLRPVVRALDAAGVPVFTFNFSNPFAAVRTLVPELEAQVARVLGQTGEPRLHLVCHSLGGLVARVWMMQNGTARVARFVTIASPHHGTALAALGIGKNAPQMRRGNAFLAQLEREEGDRGPGVRASSIYSLHDNLVAPQDTSRLPWAKNVVLSGLGHIDLLHSARLHRALLEELRAG